jgi:hypothetical protein
MFHKLDKDFLFPIDTRLKIFGNDNWLYYKMMYAGYKLKYDKKTCIHHFKSQTANKVENKDYPIFMKIAKENNWKIAVVEEVHTPTDDPIIF